MSNAIGKHFFVPLKGEANEGDMPLQQNPAKHKRDEAEVGAPRKKYSITPRQEKVNMGTMDVQKQPAKRQRDEAEVEASRKKYSLGPAKSSIPIALDVVGTYKITSAVMEANYHKRSLDSAAADDENGPPSSLESFHFPAIRINFLTSVFLSYSHDFPFHTPSFCCF